jgi:hypothetical protein
MRADRRHSLSPIRFADVSTKLREDASKNDNVASFYRVAMIVCNGCSSHMKTRM